MKPSETVALCRYVAAACPQQAMDDYTPQAWFDLLGDLRYEDAQQAVKAVVSRQTFISPAEIRAEVRRIRDRRIAPWLDKLDPPAGLSQLDERRWRREALRAVGDGEKPPQGRVAGNHALPMLEAGRG